ncbi:MAG: Hpt domain-containing protein [Candidatus Tectomicrobia bacterium]
MMGETFVVTIDAFLADTLLRLAALHEAATDSESTALEDLAHTLNGNCGYLGALGLADVCENLAEQCRAGTLDDAMEQVKHITTEFDRVRQTLQDTCITGDR